MSRCANFGSAMMLRSSIFLPSVLTFSIAGFLGGGAAACSSNTIVHVSANGGDTDAGDGTSDTEGGAAAVDGSVVPITGGDHSPYPAPTGPAPQVRSSGGSLLKAPHIVPVFFPGDALQMQLLDFLTKIGPSQFLAANVGEYGAGAADVGTSIMMASNPPMSLSVSTMASYVATNILPKVTIDANTLVVVFIPATTTVALGGNGSQTCKDVGGYHESTGNTKEAAYAIVPRCQSFVNQQPNLSTLLEVTTASATHEIIEAITDPFPNQSPAYNQVDATHALWPLILGGAETGDMCAQTPHSFGMNAELGYAVQRSWSNKAAASGHDPCVPQATGEVYFNAVYEPTDPVDVGGGVTAKGMALSVGQSKTVDVTLVTDAPMNSFNVAAVGLNPGELTISFDKKGGYNGDKLKMTVKLNSAPTGGSPLSPFFIISTYGKAQQIWPVGVIAQ